MKFFKTFFIFLIVILLSGCIQSAALLGPGITLVTTGNALQAGFQYGANKAIKNETGKDTLGHLLDVVDKIEDNNETKKSLKDLKRIDKK
jgi:hypothetical protein|tara:strand:+ start:799 stop:1068 length:270 start_codon:yes stop_codon:yes gene_type:complete